MTYSYSLPFDAIEDTLEDAIRNLLDGDPLNICLELDEYEIEELLEAQGMIADTCSVHDVLEVRSDLTIQQAWDVLKAVKGGYDVGQGISRYTIRAFAHELYGPPKVR